MSTASATAIGNRVLRQPVRFPALIVAVVLGILGMHALNLHVTSHRDMAGPVTMTSIAVDAHSARRHMSSAGHAEVPSTNATMTSETTAAGHIEAVNRGGGRGGMGGDMVMLCVAMLAAAAAALMLRPARSRIPGLGAKLPAVHQDRARVVVPRLGTGPPYAWNFSVIRC